MPRLRVLSGREDSRILARHGFAGARSRGSHVIMQRVEPESTIAVPEPDHRELRTGTLGSIIRQSRLSRALFEQ